MLAERSEEIQSQIKQLTDDMTFLKKGTDSTKDGTRLVIRKLKILTA